MERTSASLSTTIQQYLQENGLGVSSPAWQIKKSPLGEFGVFATRSIEIGEVIFLDHPIILGPRAGLEYPILCVSCYRRNNLKLCTKLCGLYVCSKQCQHSKTHQSECKIIRQWQTKSISEDISEKTFKVLTPIRSLLVSENDKNVIRCLKAHKASQHGFEVDLMKNFLQFNVKEDEEAFMRLVCAVLDANAFEVLIGDATNQSSVKGLYPLGSLANHSCTPNTIHVFDQQQHMVVRAAKFIAKDEEIFHSYSRIIWGTPTRRYHLQRTKHFTCNCDRCQDPTEFKTYMSAILCKSCKVGFVVPKSKWQCEACTQIMKKEDVAAITSLLGSALNSFDKTDVQLMIRFLGTKLSMLVSPNHETVVELKYKLIWILGYHEEFSWKEIGENLLELKKNFCWDILKLLEMLKLGQCKMKGLLLYEVYRCTDEMNRRHVHCKQKNKHLLMEAADILMYDVGAPDEIRKLWRHSIANS